jgi:hypothetical protein
VGSWLHITSNTSSTVKNKHPGATVPNTIGIGGIGIGYARHSEGGGGADANESAAVISLAAHASIIGHNQGAAAICA